MCRENLTAIYSVDLVDTEEASHRIKAIGMASLTDMLPAVDVAELAVPGCANGRRRSVNRPHRAVSLMVGMKERRLH